MNVRNASNIFFILKLCIWDHVTFIYVLYKMVVHILMIKVLNYIYLSILTVINIDTIGYFNMYLNLYNGKTR